MTVTLQWGLPVLVKSIMTCNVIVTDLAPKFPKNKSPQRSQSTWMACATIIAAAVMGARHPVALPWCSLPAKRPRAQKSKRMSSSSHLSGFFLAELLAQFLEKILQNCLMISKMVA